MSDETLIKLRLERINLASRGIRWCLTCKRYTDGTYVHAPGQAGHGNLCGPGCYQHCEPLPTLADIGKELT